MFPTSNFSEIYTLLNCPAKLYLQLIGAKSEITRKYTPRKVDSYQLGLEGESEVAEGFIPEIDYTSPKEVESSVKEVQEKIDFPDFISTLKSEMKSTAIRIKNELNNQKAILSEPKITELAMKLKKEYGIDALLHKVPYTTVPHHLNGIIDFLGLNENREFIVIEAKNKKRIERRDLIKLEYYVYGLPKGYNFTKIQQHSFELMGQLYPAKIQSHLVTAGTYNFLRFSLFKLELNIRHLITRNDDIKTKFEQKYTNYDGIAKEIPEIVELIKMKNEFESKLKISKDDLIDTMEYITKILSKGVKDGIIVNVRDGSILESNVDINFDEKIRKIWAVKKNINSKTFVCEKNKFSCSSCSYRHQCNTTIKEGDLHEDVQSITSIAHKGFSLLNYHCDDITNRLFLGSDPTDWDKRTRISMLSLRVDGVEKNTHDLLEPILSNSEWGYERWYSSRPRWKSLFVDAVVSKTLEKELRFWGH